MPAWLGLTLMFLVGVALFMGAGWIERSNARTVESLAHMTGHDEHESRRFGSFLGKEKAWGARGAGLLVMGLALFMACQHLLD